MNIASKSAALLGTLLMLSAVVHGCQDIPTSPVSGVTAGTQYAAQGPASTPAAVWQVRGNARTDPGTDYIGTADREPLVIRANAVEVARVLPNRSIGINTSSPLATLHVRKGTERHELRVEETNVGAASTIQMVNSSRTWTLESDANPDRFRIIDYRAGGARGEISILAANGYVGLGEPNPGHPLHLRNGAHVTAGGVWTNASSRASKENIRELTTDEALAAFAVLDPVRFNYRTDGAEEYVGFIAEDVPDLVATADREGLSPMDIVAVLTKVIQDQEQRIVRLEAQLNAGR